MKKFIPALIFSLIFTSDSFAFTSYSKDCAGTYCTTEFKKMNGLQQIGAHLAYETLAPYGITAGQGVTVAVVDTGVLLSHQEVAGKISGLENLSYAGHSMNEYAGNHGTHVSGTVLAAKDGNEMHGVAYGATLLGVSVNLGGECSTCFSTSQGWEALATSAFDSVKILNNSWGNSDFLSKYAIGAPLPNGYTALYNAAKALAEKDKLIVTSAGNDAWFTQTVSSGGLPFFDSSLKNNFINVVAYDPSLMPSSSDFIAAFSNLAFVAQDYSIAAPGVGIYSGDAQGTSSYDTYNGTSMAAPMVSGAAATVLSAFPFMGGKQLADTLLSNAYRGTDGNWGGFATQMRQRDRIQNADGTYWVHVNYLVFTGGTLSRSSSYENAIFLNRNCTAAGTDECEVYVNGVLIEKNGVATGNSYSTIGYSSVFGQGLLDLDSAVKGPKTLDADRLTVANDYSAADEQFFYTVNVNAGQEGADFANDIDESPSTVTGYTTKSVGLRKTGSGQLALSGEALYNGMTAVDGGTLYLRNTAVLYDVRTTGTGFLNGTGTVDGNMENKGIASPTVSYNGNFINNGGTIYYDSLNTPLTAYDIKLNSGTFAFGENALISATSGKYNIVSADNSLAVSSAFIQPTLNSIFISLSYDNPSATKIDAVVSVSALDDDAPYEKPLVGEDKKVAHALDVRAHQETAFRPYYLASEKEIKQAITQLRKQTQSVPMENLPLTEKISNNVYTHLFNISRGQVTPSSARRYGGYRGRSGGTASLDDKIWIQAIGGKAEVKADEKTGLAKVESTLFGGMMGADFQINNHLLIGFTAGFAKTKIRQDRDKTDINDYRAGLYFSSTAGIFSLNGIALGGYQQYDGLRYTGPSMNIGINKEYNGWSAEGGLNAGLDFYLRGRPSGGYNKSGFLHIRPYVAGNYAYKYQEEYKEKGDAAFILAVSDAKDSSFTGQAGIMAGIGGQRFEFMLDAGYQRLLHGDVPSVSSYFLADTTQTTFVSAGETGDKDFLSLGGGFDIRFTDKFALNLWLDNKLSENTRAHTATVTFKWFW